MKTSKISNLVMISIFTALIAVGAFIRIPVPIVPFTLQFLFTTLGGLMLGGRRGFLSVVVYINMGLIGLPVFAEGGGIGYVLRPSFGYIIGFAVAAYVTGTIAHRVAKPSYKRLLAASVAGLVIVYSCGLAYYYMISYFYLGAEIGLWNLVLYGLILAIPGDIVLCILATVIAKRMVKFMR